MATASIPIGSDCDTDMKYILGWIAKRVDTERAPIAARKALVVTLQAMIVAVSYGLSFMLSHQWIDHDLWSMFIQTLPLLLAVRLMSFYAFGLFGGWWRYAGVSDLVSIGNATLLSSGAFFFLLLIQKPLGHPLGYPRRVLVIDSLLTVCFLGGARFATRLYREHTAAHTAQRKTLVIGAGQAGTAIVRDLLRNPDLDYKPIGFLDDDLSKRGVKIHGIKVLGGLNDLLQIVRKYEVDCALVAIPSLKGKAIENLLANCRACKIDFKLVPGISERLSGALSARNVRSVRIDDLLGREPVHLDLAGITSELRDRVSLITGAGGSIGSELTRQIAQFGPRQLLLFERSENELFKLAMQMSQHYPNVECLPIVGDILDVSLLREVFGRYRPDAVFHAAAYKHVPMMEGNCFQAITNNVFGTYNVALAAKQYGANKFIMISTDKAVKPTNIMGVSKRLAELIILGLQHQKTRFIAVRFGNVLGSNCSVVPIFEDQIAHGGPLTVTHPDATRYFMTIPEAVSLILQAASMGKGGEIFLLEMGQPVRILDLARNMIRLSGLDVDKDIGIHFVGLRPGEKLHEELAFSGENAKSTYHKKIRVLNGGEVSFEQVREWIDELTLLVESRNIYGLVQMLESIVPEYTPSREVLTSCHHDLYDVSTMYRRGRTSLHHAVVAATRAVDSAA